MTGTFQKCKQTCFLPINSMFLVLLSHVVCFVWFALRRWEELKDIREMEDYSMAIATDPSKRKGFIPGAKAARYAPLSID
jgi:hypothetical protein